jgi:hypothetical protein
MTDLMCQFVTFGFPSIIHGAFLGFFIYGHKRSLWLNVGFNFDMSIIHGWIFEC